MRATTMNWVPRTRSASDSGFFAARSGSEQVSLPILDALRPLQSHQAVSHHVQIGERTGDEQAIRVLRDTAIAHLGEAEDALDDTDGVLDSGAHARARSIDDALTRLQVLVAAPALLSKVLRRGSKSFDHLALPGVGAITPDMGFSPMKQLRQQVAVAHVGGARRHRVNELGLLVHADMALHAEEPLVAFLRLMHLGVALPGGVLGRARRVDDGGIDDRARAHLHAATLQVAPDLLEEPGAKAVALEQMPELAQ